MRGAIESVASARMLDVLDHDSIANLAVVALLGALRIPPGWLPFLILIYPK